MTSAGTPVPDFQPNTPEQAEDFRLKMQKYEATRSPHQS